jgi:hypothetical protein
MQNPDAEMRRGKESIVQDEVMRTEGFLNSSCAGRSASKTRVNALMTRASIFFARSLTKWMDCRVKPGNDSGGLERNPRLHETTAG